MIVKTVSGSGPELDPESIMGCTKDIQCMAVAFCAL